MTDPAGAEGAPFHETEGVELSEIERGQGYVGVFNLGSQTYQNIIRSVEEWGLKPVYLDDYSLTPDDVSNLDAVIFSGGDGSVYDDNGPELDPRFFDPDWEMPRLGICKGFHEMVRHSGGVVERGDSGEYGVTTISRTEPGSRILLGLDEEQTVLNSHGDEAIELGEGFETTARSASGKVAIIENPDANMYAVQYHPEQMETVAGKEMIGNFLRYGASLEIDDHTPDLVDRVRRSLIEGLGDKDARIGASGGVDSMTLIKLAVDTVGPERVHAFHIDHGANRRIQGVSESDQVMDALRELVPGAERLDFAERFLSTPINLQRSHETGLPATLTMREVLHSEDKRAVFKGIYAQVFREARGEDPNSKFGQGTLYPDLAESGHGGRTAVIKSHHNVGIFDSDEEFYPFGTLFKDQVRYVAHEIGLPEWIAERQPFPGPGLFVRIVCAEQPYLPDDAEQLMSTVDEFAFGNYKLGLMPIRVTGQQGDERTYDNSRGVTITVDSPDDIDWKEMSKLADAIPQGHGLTGRVNRTLFIVGEPIEGVITDITPTHIDEETLEIARTADDIALSILRANGHERDIAQSLVGILPTPLGVDGNRTAILRTFLTKTFTDGRAAVPGIDFDARIFTDEIVPALQEIPGIGRVGVDLTRKPPGTTEFE